MKTELAVLAIVFFMSGMLMVAKADSVSLFSSAATTTNNTASPTQNLDPNSVWAPPLPGSSWVSNANTGNILAPGFIVVPNGTAVTFTATFTLTGTVTSAILNVFADDTASVVVNGTQIFPASFGHGFPECAAIPIGCITSTEGTFATSQLAPYLKDGVNNIQFTVYQVGSASFGLDYSGAINTVNTVPEPGTMLLLGTGLLGVAGAARRKLRGRH